MKTVNIRSSKEEQSKLIATRIIELEKYLVVQDDFKQINNEQNFALQNLKKIVGEGNWLVLDEYVCAKNAECEYFMNYFYINGLSDGKNIFN